MTSETKRLLLAWIVGAAAGLGGEALLFLEGQCRGFERVLKEDFKVILFLKPDFDETKMKVLEEQVRALPDVEDVRGITRQEAISELRRENPELMESVTLLSENPLSPAYEVRLADDALGRVEQWIQQAQPLAAWADIRYKSAQVQAILQAQFYGRFLDLALSLIVCLTALAALAGLWPTGRAASRAWTLPAGHKHWPASGVKAAASALGAVCGAAATSIMVAPMRILSPWWSWPSAGRQAVLVLGAAVAGWVLCGHRD